MVHIKVRKSEHAVRRQRQRAISDEAVQAALLWGRPLRLADSRTAYYLDRRSSAAARRAGTDYSAYEGTVAIEGSDGGLVTVIRARQRFRRRRAS